MLSLSFDNITYNNRFEGQKASMKAPMEAVLYALGWIKALCLALSKQPSID